MSPATTTTPSVHFLPPRLPQQEMNLPSVSSRYFSNRPTRMLVRAASTRRRVSVAPCRRHSALLRPSLQWRMRPHLGPRHCRQRRMRPHLGPRHQLYYNLLSTALTHPMQGAVSPSRRSERPVRARIQPLMRNRRLVRHPWHRPRPPCPLGPGPGPSSTLSTPSYPASRLQRTHAAFSGQTCALSTSLPPSAVPIVPSAPLCRPQRPPSALSTMPPSAAPLTLGGAPSARHPTFPRLQRHPPLRQSLQRSSRVLRCVSILAPLAVCPLRLGGVSVVHSCPNV